MPLLSRIMIRASFICLIIGFLLGGLILSAKGGVVDARVWAWLHIHIILLLNGWLLQLSLGVAYWITPRIHLGERGRRSFAWSGYALFTLGIIILLFSLVRFWWSDAAQLTAPSIMLQIMGIGLFVFHLYPRIRPAMVRANLSKLSSALNWNRSYQVRSVSYQSPSSPMSKLPIELALTFVLSFIIVGMAIVGLGELGSSIENPEVVLVEDDLDLDIQSADSILPITITIVGTEFHFEPQEFELKVGIPVELKFENRGTTEHDFVIKDMPIAEKSDLGISLYAWFGETTSITFTPITAGEYDIHCSILGHKEAGMTGKVVVVE